MKIPVLNKEMQLIIPTHQRTTCKQQKTWFGLPKSLREQTLIITSTKEDMKALRKNLDYEHVYAINDPSIDGIAKKRQWLIEHIKSDFIFQLDDDLTFQHRCKKKYRQVNDKNLWEVKPKYKGKINFIELQGFDEDWKDKAWQSFFTKIFNGGFVHGGLGVRMGNNRDPLEYKIVGRAMQAIFNHRKTLLKHGIKFDDVRFREDFHVTMSLLCRGYPNIVNNRLIVNPEAFGKAGGCSDERTIEASNKEAVRLAKRHHPFVKTVKKEYNTSVHRTEVVCYWAKAYQSAKKQDRRIK